MKQIMDKWRAHYKRLAAQNILAESFVEKEEMPLQEPGSGSPEDYLRMAAEQEMMANVFAIGEDGDNDSVLGMIRADEWEEQNPQDPQGFMDSLNSGKRGGFLTSYSQKDLASMRLFKLKEHNLGFAIKEDGDIVSVHNNSGVGGVGREMMAAAIRNGGQKLDHFDGFLTGFYEKNGFGKVADAWAWNDKYAPSNWKYEAVSIFDPSESIYADKLKKYKSVEDMPDDLKAKIGAYKSGRPMWSFVSWDKSFRKSSTYKKHDKYLDKTWVICYNTSRTSIDRKTHHGKKRIIDSVRWIACTQCR